jgi:hypothetical protein
VQLTFNREVAMRSVEHAAELAGAPGRLPMSPLHGS